MGEVAAEHSALERARSLRHLIAEDAEASERLGRPTDRVARALQGGRLLMAMVPPEGGGLGASRAEFFETVEAIAEADGSAGWCASVCNATNLTAFHGLPSEGRTGVFDGGEVSFWTSLQPTATAEPELGGWRVSYPGTFGSGSSLSDWVLVTGNVGGPHEGRYRAFVVPRAEVRIVEGSWDVLGLRATASLDYRIEEQFVDGSRSWAFDWSAQAPGGPFSALESVRLNAIGLAAFASGVGRRALAELIASAKKTKRTVGDGVQADDHVVQFGVGELEGRVRAARGHLLGLVQGMDERAETGRATTLEDAVAISQATNILARAARDMTVFAFDYASVSAVHARHPLQRCLRDIFTGLKHASFTPAILGRVGRVRLGLPFGGTAL